MPEIYFDNAASTPLHPLVADGMVESLQKFANPSSLHRPGFVAEQQVQAARQQVADLLRVNADKMFFLPGGTEANNLAIGGSLRRNKGRVLVSQVEHPSVREVCLHLEREGWPVKWIAVDGQGRVDLSHLAELAAEPVQLVTVMAANNETGTIQPLDEICRQIRQQHPRALIHVDAVQAVGKMDFEPEALGVDMVSISAHKMLGPKGIAALYVANPQGIKPLLFGGGQEESLWPGTENTWAITGLGITAQLWLENGDAWRAKLDGLRRKLVRGLTDLGGCIISPADGVPHILAVSFPGHKGEVLVNAFSAKGLYVSTGAACSGKKGAVSHVAQAMGIKDDVAQAMLRFSLSPLNQAQEVDKALGIVEEVLQELDYVRGRPGS